MATKDDEKNQALFPEGYEYFKTMADFTATRLREIDDRIQTGSIENPREVSHRLRFDPPALRREQEKIRNRESGKQLEYRKEQVEKQGLKQIEKEIQRWNLDAETATRIRTATVDTFHPNPFREKSDRELRQDRKAQKDIDHSQNYMRTLIDRFRSTDKPKQKIALVEKTEEIITPAMQKAPFDQNAPKVIFQTGALGGPAAKKVNLRQKTPSLDRD